MQRMKHLFYIFVLMFVFASSAWSTDFNCPGGKWELVSSTGYKCNSYSVISGDTKTEYCWSYCCAGCSDGSDCVAAWQRIYGSFVEIGVPPGLTPPYSDCCLFYPCSCRCTMTYGILGISHYEWRCPDQCVDNDKDGYKAYNSQSCPTGNDCNDGDNTVYPGAPELCDGKDNNCNEQVDEGCCPKITSFTGNNTTINPSSGGDVSFSFATDRPYDSYEITVAGEKINGTSWNGKIGGHLVEPGTYPASVTVKKGQCSDTKNLTVKVTRTEDCKLKITIGSTANIASGNLSHSQELFSTRGTGLTTNLTFNYNSLDGYSGTLGKGWVHSYDIALKGNSYGEVILREGDGRRRLYTPNGSGYTSQPGDDSTLIKNADGTFTIIHKDGQRYNFNNINKIASIADRNNNAITFTHTNGDLTTITDSAGRTTTLNYNTAHRISTINDPNGNVHSFVYSGNDLIGMTTQPGGSQSAPTSWTYTYYENSFMKTKTDPNGYTTTYTYDEDQRVTSSTDPEGNVKSITYPNLDDTSQSKTTTVTEKDGGVWTYVYDTQAGTLTSKTDPENGTTSYTYDENRSMTSKTEPDGTTTSYTYDSIGNMTSTTDALDQTTSYTYNSYGQVISVTAPDSTTTTYEYDAKGNLTQTKDAAGEFTIYSYDSRGNVVQITNAAGQTTTYSYDETGNLVSITDSTGAVNSMSYDSAGNVISKTDPNGGTTTYEYDGLNRIVKVMDPAGNTTTFGYDKNGNRTSVTDANGNTTLFEYNYNGKIVKITDALGYSTTYSSTTGSGCSSCGTGGGDLLASVTDPNGNVRKFEYDSLERRIKEIDPSGKETIYTYDAKGNIQTRTDANGHTTIFAYDPLSRLQKLTDPMQGAVQFEYDTSGKAARVTDALGNATAYEYDAASHVTKTVSPDAGTTIYTYNADGSLKTKTDGNGITATYIYDDAGRITRIEYPNAGENISYTYDNCTNGKGRVCTMSDPSGTTAYEYDQRGHISKETKNILNITYSTSYEYDKVGNIKSVTYPSGRKISYSYNKVNRPTDITARLTNVASLVNGLTYDGVANLTSSTYGNGLTQTWTYDLNNRVKTISAPNALNLNYSYDFAGNITAIADQIDSTKSRVFTYDTVDRLTSAVGPWGSLSWTYDANGNRLSQKNGTSYTYSYDANRLTSITNGHTSNYQYDAVGNTINDGTKDFIYNQNNRLIKAVENGNVLGEYTYNGNGQRVIKKTGPAETNSASSQNIIYHYDLAGKLIEETDGNGKVIVDYVYLANKPLAMIRKQGNNEETFYYHNDHLGTPKVLTDKFKKVVWNVELDPFGNEVSTKGRQGSYIRNVENNLCFPGQYYDAETGLHYNGLRTYSPKNGRYLEADPIGIGGGPNPYNYVNSKPTILSDPNGTTYYDPISTSFWLEVAAAGAMRGYTLSAILLTHALEPNPSSFTASGGSLAIEKIKASAEYQQTRDAIIRNTPNLTQIPSSSTGIIFRSGDLYYAIHKADMKYNGYKWCDDKWELYVHIQDTYNFEPWPMRLSPGVILNNLAASAQQNGDLSPFGIDLYFQDKRP